MKRRLSAAAVYSLERTLFAGLLGNDGFAQLAQFRLDRRGIGTAHADESLLPRRFRFELRIREGIQHARLRKRDRALDVGRGEQVVDDLDQAIIEVLRRM